MLTPDGRMDFHYFENNQLIFVDKPCGFSIHTLIHQLSLQLKQNLTLAFSPKQIESQNSGAVVLAKTLNKAQEILSAKICLTYYFIIDKKSSASEFKADIETHFMSIKRSPFYELWQVTTSNGSCKNVFAQAGSLGLHPIFPLHLGQVEIANEIKWLSPLPRYFERLGLIRDPELIEAIKAFDQRQRLYNFLAKKDDALRLIHRELPHLRLDLFGECLWGYWYKDTDPTEKDLDRLQCLASLLGKKWLLRKMQNRGKDPLTKTDWKSENFPEIWQTIENNIQFELRSSKGLSPGLFLDQRNNRKLTLEYSENKKVLNLFSYTCGFSVFAAKGSAKEVVSVDVSQDFLDWGKRNFLLNNLNPENYEFFKQDSLLFLKGAAKRNRAFDLIICDPPSFSRNKDQIFNLENNFVELLSACALVMNPGGLLIFSCNYEKWSRSQFENQLIKISKLKLIQNPVFPGYDFEKPDEERLMKSFFLEKIAD